MATYVNNLRLKEIVTGAESGTWGTSTNTNLELIADAFGSGTEAITTNADAHTTTVADGAADEGRAIYMKYTGALDSACTITLAPNTINKLWIIENATSGSQNIIISQGSGANITIGNGNVSAIFTDGAGGGAAVLDALADLELSSTLTVAGAVTMSGDVSVGDDLTLVSDAAILNFGVNSDVNLTHVHDTGLLLNSTRQLQFNDSSQYISGTSATVLSIAATDEIDLTATAVDLNGTLDVSGTSTLTGAATFSSTVGITGRTTASGGLSVAINDSGLIGVDIDPTASYRALYVRGTSAISNILGELNIGSTGASAGAGGLHVTGSIIGLSTIAGTTITASGDVIIGTNPAAAGDIRLNKNFGIFTRNDANDANKAVVSENTVTGNDTLDFGDNTKWSALRFHCSTSNVMELTATAINLNKATTMNNAAIKMTGLATSDPSVAGQLWSNSGVVTVSAG